MGCNPDILENVCPSGLRPSGLYFPIYPDYNPCIISLSSQAEDIKEIIDEMEEGGICAVKCANESDVCAKIYEEDNIGNKSGFYFVFFY